MIWDVWNEFIIILGNTNLLLYKYYEKNVQYYSARDALVLLMINYYDLCSILLVKVKLLITGFTICENYVSSKIMTMLVMDI